MKAAGLMPTVVTFGCLLNACRGVKDPEYGVERAYALLTEVQLSKS